MLLLLLPLVLCSYCPFFRLPLLLLLRLPLPLLRYRVCYRVCYLLALTCYCPATATC